MPSPCDGTLVHLESRPWDSDFFQFPVAEICGSFASAEALEKALLVAKRNGIDLVYWCSDTTAPVPNDILHRFRGTLVDRKITYATAVTQEQAKSHLRNGRTAQTAIIENPIGPASDKLVQLAIEAGTFSRFNTDPRFPPSLFHSLYERWITRSTQHEIADAVLVAVTIDEQPLGMVTIATDAGTGTIGLLAVSPESQGRGIGRSLMVAARDWMAVHGMAEILVTTQQANVPACRFYERCGYTVRSMSTVYHFWPTY